MKIWWKQQLLINTRVKYITGDVALFKSNFPIESNGNRLITFLAPQKSAYLGKFVTQTLKKNFSYNTRSRKKIKTYSHFIFKYNTYIIYFQASQGLTHLFGHASEGQRTQDQAIIHSVVPLPRWHPSHDHVEGQRWEEGEPSKCPPHAPAHATMRDNHHFRHSVWIHTKEFIFVLLYLSFSCTQWKLRGAILVLCTPVYLLHTKACHCMVWFALILFYKAKVP